MFRVDLVDDIADDADVDTGVITERDIRVDHDDFHRCRQLAHHSRVADVITFHRGGLSAPVIEPEDEPRQKALSALASTRTSSSNCSSSCFDPKPTSKPGSSATELEEAPRDCEVRITGGVVVIQPSWPTARSPAFSLPPQLGPTVKFAFPFPSTSP
jgi:hypothetical protein